MAFLVKYLGGGIYFYETREHMLDSAISDLSDLSIVEIAEISPKMSVAGNRKETLEWKQPSRGGITW